MLEFRKKSNGGSAARKRSVDGFVSNSGSLDAASGMPARQLDTTKKVDGFTVQPQINGTFAQALENHAALPSIDMELDMAGAEETPKKKQRSKIRTLAKGFGIAFSAVAICGLLVGGFIFGKGWLAAHKIFKGGGSSSTLFSTDIKPEKLKGEGDGRINILLLGAGGGDHDGADLTDSIVIASVDPVAKDIALLSIPRDLWVKVPNYWSMKINAAYASAKNEKLDNGGTE
jgi:hypothetical protein